jgi:putative spermidine/putrescine transport system substrate-binding protein
MIGKTRGRPNRRAFLGTAIAAGAAPYVFTRRAAADDKTLVVYNFDGFLGKAVKEQWIDPFATKHGVKVDTITMQGSSPPMAKIKAQVEAGKPDADAIIMQQTDYVFAVRNNLLITIGRDEIPEYANFYPQFVTPHGPGLCLWCYGIGYNTEHIKQRPAAWKDLWNPAHKGKLAINEALFEQALQMTNLAFTGKLLPIDDATFARLSELRPNLLTLWSTGAQAEQLFRAGEVWISPMWNSRISALRDQKVPVEFVVPKEGLFVRFNPMCIPRGARNPGLAKEWIRFICTADRQQALAEKGYQGSPHRLVKLSPDTAARVVVSNPDAFKNAVTEDFAQIVDNLPEWRRRWDAWKQQRG